MGATSIDYGQAKIKAFNDAAAAGHIVYDPGVAHQAARVYAEAIETLQQVRKGLNNAVNAQGFGGFPTGRDLQKGFSTKAQDGIRMIDQLIEGAFRLKEAYLRAGNLMTEADDASAAAIRHAQQALAQNGGSNS